MTDPLVTATGRFRDWSRTPEGATVMLGVVEGSAHAENELLRAFIESINVPDPGDRLPTLYECPCGWVGTERACPHRHRRTHYADTPPTPFEVVRAAPLSRKEPT